MNSKTTPPPPSTCETRRPSFFLPENQIIVYFFTQFYEFLEFFNRVCRYVEKSCGRENFILRKI